MTVQVRTRLQMQSLTPRQVFREMAALVQAGYADSVIEWSCDDLRTVWATVVKDPTELSDEEREAALRGTAGGK